MPTIYYRVSLYPTWEHPVAVLAPMMTRMANRGPLEQTVMECLWASTEPRSVAEVLEQLDTGRDLAYTTVMTVLDRLAKKQLVTRERVDRSWRYLPAQSQDVVVAHDLAGVLEGVPEAVRIAALRGLFEALSENERAALDASRIAT